MEERVGMSGEIGESSGNIKTLLDVGDTVSLFWGVYGVERSEGNYVSMVKIGLESEPEDIIVREVGVEREHRATAFSSTAFLAAIASASAAVFWGHEDLV